MEQRCDFLCWLSKKLYEVSVGFYVTIGLLMLLPVLFVGAFGIHSFVASFMAFFIVIGIRTVYESVVIYEASITSLSWYKISIFTFANASIMMLVLVLLKPKIGYFSIPVSIVIATLVVGKLKTILLPIVKRTGFFVELSEKLALVAKIRYAFYGNLVGITYLAYARYDYNFYYSFAVAFFVGMLFEEFSHITKVYEKKITTKTVFLTCVWALVCSVVSALLVMILMQRLGCEGPAATITSVILLKLIQPIGLRKIVLG